MHKKSPIKIWRRFGSRYRMLGNQCKKCNRKFYPSVKLCEKCRNIDLKEYEFKPKGKLITWSKIYAGPKGFESFVPYIIGIIELEDGERITSQIVDVDESELKYGMEMEPVFRKYFQNGSDGIIHYGLKFKKLCLKKLPDKVLSIF